MKPTRSWNETLTVRLDVKAVDDKGTFEGYASVFGKVDLVNDVVEPGAFARTIEQNKGTFPLFWFHDPSEPIGSVTLSEDAHGLKVDRGSINLDTQRGREVHSGMMADPPYITEMSIGYKAIVKEIDDTTGIRSLKEVALKEVSLLPSNFAAMPDATVDSVKAATVTMTPDQMRAMRRTRERLASAMQMMDDMMATLAPSKDAGELDADVKADIAEVDEMIDAAKTSLVSLTAPTGDSGEHHDDDEPKSVPVPSDILAVFDQARATLAR